MASLYANVQDLEPGTPEYYNARWQDCLDKFSYKETGLPEWDGSDAGTKPTEGSGTTGDPYKIYTAEQFRWALKNQTSCILMNNLDLGGRNNRNWTGISYTTAAVVDGNGFTVYNLYSSAAQRAGLFEWAGADGYGFVLKNLTVSNSRVYVSQRFAAPLIAGFDGGVVDNCAVIDSIAWQDKESGIEPPLVSGAVTFGWGYAGINYSGDARWHGYKSTITNTYTRNVSIRGKACSSGFTEVPYNALIENCASMDGTIVVSGGHSGGFASCDYGPITYRNCFTNNNVYGNATTGVFQGALHNDEHSFENCWASGKIEGTSIIGGFMPFVDGASKITLKNCYSTSMVGMSSGGTNMGGFVGIAAANTTFTNCYAAGEVGTLKSNDSGVALDDNGNPVTSVGGFAGSNQGATFDNCYYDKQTTGSRENALGTTQDSAVPGVTGLLTKSLTTTSPDDSAYKLSKGTYPQIKVFSEGDAAQWGNNQLLADYAKAYSQASASTVFLYPSMNDDSKYDASTTDYDTVRRIRYAFPLTNDTMVGDAALDTVWKYYDDGERFPNESPVNPDAKIITLSTETNDDTMNDVSVTSVATGIGWLRTESVFNGVTGSRNLRLVPTTSVAIGKDGKAIVGSDDTVYYQDDANPPTGNVAYQKLSEELTKADHREGITFIVASSKNLDDYMNDNGSYTTNAEKLKAHNIVALDFKSLSGTTSEAVADSTTGKKTNLDYTVTLKNSSGHDEKQVVRLSVAKVIPADPTNPDAPGIMSAPLEWDSADNWQQLFEGERTATQDELGKYVLSYQWMDTAKKTVQAQGTKYLTVVSPLSLVYRTGYGDNTTLYTDPGAYQNSDPAAADRMPADPERHGYQFSGWVYERENASGGHDAFAAGTLITAVTDSRGNTNSVIGIQATWTPNKHDLIIKDKKGGTEQKRLSTDYDTNLRTALESHVPSDTGEGEFLGWRIESGFDGRTDQYVSASDTMPDNAVVVYPVFGTEVSASLTAHNETRGTIDGTQHNRVGDIITYEIAIVNNQPDLIWRNATITDPLIVGQDFVKGSAKLIKPEAGDPLPLDDACFDSATNAVVYTVPEDVQTDETYVLMFQVKLNENAPFVGQGTDKVITNSATVDGEDANGGEVNANTNEVKLPGSAYVEFTPADKWVSKNAQNLTDPDATKSQVGDRIRYTLEMGNKSDDPHSRWQNGWFYDAVPKGLQVDSSTITLTYPDGASPNGTSTSVFPTAYNDATGEISVAAGTLKAGEKATLTFEAIVTADAVGQSVKNTAWAVTDEPAKPNDPPVTPGKTEPAPAPDPDNPDPDPTDPVGPGTDTINLSVAKTAGVTQASPGSVVPYTITVTNSGNTHAKNVVVSDTLPTGLEYVSSVPAAQVSDGTVTWTCTVPAGMTVTRTVMARVTADATGPLVNDVVVTSPDVDGPITPPSKPSVDVVPSPDEPVVAVSKVATTDTAVTGGQLTYYITVTNSGAQEAKNVVVTDALPPGLVYASATDGGTYRNGLMSWTVDLPAQSSKQLSVTANVTAKTGELVNTATAVHDGVANVSNYVTTSVSDGTKPKNEPQLSLKKTSSVSQAAVGSEIPYTITVTNTGAGDAKNVTLTDTLPEGLEYVDGSASPAPESAADGVITWKVDVPSGQSVTRTLKAKVATTASAGAKLENAVEASNPSGGDPIVPSELPLIEVVDGSTGGNQPILGISKKADVDTVTSGDDLTYTITVTNTGTAEAKGVTVSDTLPAGLSYQSGGTYDAKTGAVSWTVDVPASGSTDCTLVAKVDAKAGSLSNTATATFGDTQVKSEAVSTSVTSSGGAAKAQLSIKKTTSVTEASVGASIPYVITVTNTGDADAKGVTITDTLPVGLTYESSEPAGAVSADGKSVTWSVDVPAGGEVKRQITAKVDAGVSTGSQLANNVSVSDPEGGSPIEPSVDPPTVDVIDPTNKANIAISKVASADTVVSGSQITYTIVVTNSGSADATDVKVSDALPTGMTLAAATDGGALEGGAVTWTVDVAAGASKQLKVTADVTAATGTLVNAAQATLGDKTVTSESVSTQVKASETGGTPEAVLSVQKTTNVDEVVQGATIDYAIVVSNTGDADAKGATVSDTLPSGLMYLSSDPAGQLSADRKTVTWTVDVAAGSSVTRTITVLVTGSQGQSIENSVVVTNPDKPDAPPIDPPDKPVIEVTDAADMSAALAVDRSVANKSDNLVYTVSITNSGTVDAKGVVVTNKLPKGISFTSASDGGTYVPEQAGTTPAAASFDLFASVASFFGLGDPTGEGETEKPEAGSVTWTVDVPAGATITRTVQADVLIESGLLVATGNLKHLETAVPINNVQTKVLPESTGTGEPNISVEKTTTATQVKPGYEIPYTIMVRNTGTADARGVSVVDALPAGLIYQSSSPAGQLSNGDKTVSWMADIPAGGVASFTVLAKVADDAAGSVMNDVMVTPDGGDPITPPNPPDTPVVGPDDPGDGRPHIGIAKSVDAISSAKGDTVTYTITVSNTGAAAATDVLVSDAVPEGLDSVVASDGGSYDAATRAATWTIPTLDAGATKTFTLQAEVTAAAGSLVNMAQATHEGITVQSEPVVTDVETNSDPGHVPAPSLVMSKTTSVQQAAQGATVPYIITVRNIGDAAADNVTVSDVLPEGLTYVDSLPQAASSEGGTITWNTSIPAGGSSTFALYAKITGDVGTTISNTAQAQLPDGTTVEPGSDPSITVSPSTPKASVHIAKHAGRDQAVANGKLVYKLSLTNTGNGDATGVVVSDALPVGTSFMEASDGGTYDQATGRVTWTVDVPALGRKEVTLTVKVDALAGSLKNMASSTHEGKTETTPVVITPVSDAPTEADPEPSIDKAVANLTAQKEGRSDPDDQSTWRDGDELEFTITAQNTKTDSLWTDVVITDALPAGLTLVEGSVQFAAPGQTASSNDGAYDSIARSLRVEAGDIAGGQSAQLTYRTVIQAGLDWSVDATLRNIAQGAGYDPDGVNPLVEEDAVAIPTPEPHSRKELTKTAENLTDPQAAIVQVGDRVRYIITLKNAEPNPRAQWKGAYIYDEVPEGLDVDTTTLKLIDANGISHDISDCYDPTTRQLVVSIGVIKGGTQAVVSFEAVVPIGAVGKDLSNVGMVGELLPDPNNPTAPPDPGKPDDSVLPNPVKPDGNTDPKPTDPASPNEDSVVKPSDPDSSIQKTVKSLAGNEDYVNGEEVLYTVVAENTRLGSLWSSVIITDVLPAGVNLDPRSIRLIGPDGVPSDVDPSSYNATTRILAVPLGDVEGGQRYVLNYTARLDFAAGQGDAVNHVVANGASPSGPAMNEANASVTPPLVPWNGTVARSGDALGANAVTLALAALASLVVLLVSARARMSSLRSARAAARTCRRP